jgi:uncharacterized membrane protein|tara:strand:- start:4027 stop:4209 length:183 start_codon:yes stop_codon:yes gene_type:complete
MSTWYYTLIFILSILITLNLGGRFIFNLISLLPEKMELSEKEKLIYGFSISYLITYLIYL